jgi:hypothetical protein
MRIAFRKIFASTTAPDTITAKSFACPGRAHTMRLPISSVALSALWIISGCDNGKTAVSGSVRHAGNPVSDGLIELIPIEGTPGGSCGSRIADGKYVVPNSAGLRRGGVYKVVLRGFRKQMQPDPTNPSQLVEVSENYLPAEWGDQSTHRIEVSADGSAGKFDFDIE